VRRAFVAALAGIAALGAVSALLVLRGGAAVAPPAPGPAADPVAPPPRVPLPLPSQAVFQAAPTQVAPEPPRPAAPRPGAPEPSAAVSSDWGSVPVAAREAGLGPWGPAFRRGLLALRGRLSACADPDVEARYGAQRPARVPGQERQGPAVLILELETTEGGMRIVDAPAESLGHASEGRVSCAQAVLRGAVVPVPGVHPGTRQRLRWGLP
jgi:hypothetical protein